MACLKPTASMSAATASPRRCDLNGVSFAGYLNDVVPAKAGTQPLMSFVTVCCGSSFFITIACGYGSRGACHRARVRATRWLARDDGDGALRAVHAVVPAKAGTHNH